MLKEGNMYSINKYRIRFVGSCLCFMYITSFAASLCNTNLLRVFVEAPQREISYSQDTSKTARKQPGS